MLAFLPITEGEEANESGRTRTKWQNQRKENASVVPRLLTALDVLVHEGLSVHDAWLLKISQTAISREIARFALESRLGRLKSRPIRPVFSGEKIRQSSLAKLNLTVEDAVEIFLPLLAGSAGDFTADIILDRALAQTIVDLIKEELAMPSSVDNLLLGAGLKPDNFFGPADWSKYFMAHAVDAQLPLEPGAIVRFFDRYRHHQPYLVYLPTNINGVALAAAKWAEYFPEEFIGRPLCGLEEVTARFSWYIMPRKPWPKTRTLHRKTKKLKLAENEFLIANLAECIPAYLLPLLKNGKRVTAVSGRTSDRIACRRQECYVLNMGGGINIEKIEDVRKFPGLGVFALKPLT